MEEILNPTICNSFLQLRNIRGIYSKYYKTIFPKLILHLHISYQLDDVSNNFIYQQRIKKIIVFKITSICHHQEKMIIFYETYINCRITFRDVLKSTCCSLLLPSKRVQQNCQNVFKDFKWKSAF